MLARYSFVSHRRREDERGIALVVALLLLAILSGLTIAMFLSVNSDMISNHYYRNFRGSYYAADSGLAIVRQDLKNRLTAGMAGGTSSTPPLTATKEAAIVEALTTAWASSSVFKPITDGKSVSDSVVAKFRIEPGSLTLLRTDCHTDATPTTCVGVTKAKEWYYKYQYHMVAVGMAGTAHQNRIEESGTVTVFYPVDTSEPKKFSGYGLFVEKQDYCPSDSQGWASGDVYGRVYSGNCFTFAAGGSWTFHSPVKCTGNSVAYRFNNSGSCVYKTDVPPVGATSNGVTINPAFTGGLTLNASPMELPENSYHQKQAVLDAKGEYGPTDVEWKNEAAGILKSAADGKAYSGKSGVYLPYDDKNNFIGGGIYVEGDATVKLTTGTSGDYLQQTYTIVNNGVTTQITVNQLLNKNWKADGSAGSYTMDAQGFTQVSYNGGPVTTIQGIPIQNDATGFVDNATMLYVNGTINSLGGQVQDDTALTVAAAGEVWIDHNLKYKTPPINTADTNVKDLELDAAIPGNDKGQALGVFTANGDIHAGIRDKYASEFYCNGKNSKNGLCMEVDASLASISNGGSGSMDIPDGYGWSTIDQLNIVGGRIANKLSKTSALKKRTVYFDQRYGTGFAPPFFPSTKLATNTPTDKTAVVQFQRQQWLNQNSVY